MTISTTNLDSTVKQYILDCIDLDCYDESASNPQEAAKKVISFIISEADFPRNRQLFGSDQGIIANHLAGLPSYIDIEYRNHEIINLAVKWGSLPEDYTEKQADKVLDNWFNFIAAKLIQISNGYRVKGLTFDVEQ